MKINQIIINELSEGAQPGVATTTAQTPQAQAAAQAIQKGLEKLQQQSPGLDHSFNTTTAIQEILPDGTVVMDSNLQPSALQNVRKILALGGGANFKVSMSYQGIPSAANMSTVPPAQPQPGVAEASNTMQRYGQKILKRAKAARAAELEAARAAELEPKKEEPPAPSVTSPISTRDLMQQLKKPKNKNVAEATGDERFDTIMGRMQKEPTIPDPQMPPTDVKDLYQWAVKNRKPYHKIFAEWANREGFKAVAPALQKAGNLDTDALDYWTPEVWKIYWGEVHGIDSEMPDHWRRERVPEELRDYLETVFDAYDNIWMDWPTEYRQIGKQGVAEGMNNWALKDTPTAKSIPRTSEKNNWSRKDIHNRAYDFPPTNYDKDGKNMYGQMKPELTSQTNKKKKGVAEGDVPFRGVGGAFNRGDNERHDLDPTDWYIVKDGEMFSASIYPRQVQQAISQGFSRTRAEAQAQADSQGVAEAGNANSGRRGPNFQDNSPAIPGRVEPLPQGLKHHADASRYGGTEPDVEDDRLLGPAQRHRLHQAVTPDDWFDESQEKIAGRHDPDDFDNMVGRLKQLAGAGPLKTVWDPEKRVYRNVPHAVQPPQQPKKARQ